MISSIYSMELVMKQFFKKTIVNMGLFVVIMQAEVPATAITDNNIVWTIPEKKLPLPSCASEEIQKTLAGLYQPNIEARRDFTSKSKEEWKEWIEYARVSGEYGIKKRAEKYNVSIKKEIIDGVNVYTITPKSLVNKDTKHLFVYLHGGAYMFGGGMSALSEAMLIASRVKIPVISIDYRMPPDYPYPTAIEDVVRVYQSLIKTHAPKSIALGGSSSGAGLALATVHKLKALKLALPAALFIGTPWADLTKNGDSLYTNEGIDRKIVTYDGFIAAAAKLYANGIDLKNPGLSPVYGDFSGFPPTMLVTGTRDLFLSLTVRVHRKMKKAGVIADLNVYEGLSHVEYFIVPDAPESIEVYSELREFLRKNLR